MTGNILHRLRTARGYTPYDIARQCGWTLTKVINMEAHGKSYTVGLRDRNATRARDWGRFLNAMRVLTRKAKTSKAQARNPQTKRRTA